MEIKTIKQCEDKRGALPSHKLLSGRIYRLVSGGPTSPEHGKYYIACGPYGYGGRATGAVSLATGFRLDGLFLTTTWEEVKGHVCIEE